MEQIVVAIESLTAVIGVIGLGIISAIVVSTICRR